MHKIIPAILLIASTAPTAGLALEEMADADLSLATAQDGLSVQFKTEAPVGENGISIGKLSWEDNVEPMPVGVSQYSTADTRDKHQLDFNNVTFNNLDVTLRMQSGSNGADTASNLSVDIQPFEMTAASMVVQGARVNASTVSTPSNLGQLVADHNAVTSLNIDIKNGLFNAASNTFNLRVGLEDANYYFSKGTAGQLIIGDVTANIIAKGKLSVDDIRGLTFEGDLDLFKDEANPANPSEGLQFSLLRKGTAGLIGAATADKAQGIGKIGWFGKYTGVVARFRGTQELTTASSVTTASEFGLIGGTAGNKSIIGKSGIALSLTGMRPTDASAGWLIGEAGVGGTTALETTSNSGHSIVMTDSRPFRNVSETNTRGVTDFGNIYLNLTNSKYMQMRNHINNNLTKATSFGVAGVTNNAKQAITPNLGYTVVNATNPTLNFFTQTNNKTQAVGKEGLFLGLRNFNSQAVFAKTAFKANNVAPSSASTFGEWSLVTLVHGVDANAHIYEYDADSIGFDYMVQTRGKGEAFETTSFGVLDTTNMLYTGILNLDLFSAGSGYIDITTNNVRLTFNKMLLAFDFGVGGGIYLPGAPGQPTATAADFHNNPRNQLFKVKGRINAVNSSFNLVTNGTDNRIRVDYDVRLQKNTLNSSDVETTTALANSDLSFLHLIEGGDQTTGAFEGITGRISGNAELNIMADKVGVGVVADFNAADPFTIRNIGMYPQGNASQFKDVAAFTIKSGSVAASFDIKPVNRTN